MGIGTSLGAYFETHFDHHAGNEYLINPNSTPDNNELSTNEVMPKPDEEPLTVEISLTDKGGLLTPMERINQYPEMFEAGRQAVEIEKLTGKMPSIKQKGLRGGSYYKEDLS